jgi:hypothetical protein
MLLFSYTKICIVQQVLQKALYLGGVVGLGTLYLQSPGFRLTLTAGKKTFSKAHNPIHMKTDTQAILQYSSYPLEPIVALTVIKNYQSYLRVVYSEAKPPSPLQIQKEGFVYKTGETDDRWFGNYE